MKRDYKNSEDRKPWFLIFLLAAWIIFGCCMSMRAQDPQSRARAALALAGTTPSSSVRKARGDCGCSGPADCTCGVGCRCSGCFTHSKQPPSRSTATSYWLRDETRRTWWLVHPDGSNAPPADCYPDPVPVLPTLSPVSFGGFGGDFDGGFGGFGGGGGCSS